MIRESRLVELINIVESVRQDLLWMKEELGEKRSVSPLYLAKYERYMSLLEKYVQIFVKLRKEFGDVLDEERDETISAILWELKFMTPEEREEILKELLQRRAVRKEELDVG